MKKNKEPGLSEKPICKRCGTCCRRGGPALHHEDQDLLAREIIRPENLVTVRQGEPALNPLTSKVEPASKEFIKIAGIPGSWQCIFYDEDSSACRIHQNSPLECRLLECRDTAPLERVIGRDYLNRQDIIPAANPIINNIADHDRQCSYQEANRLVERLVLGRDNSDICNDLNKIILRDLSIRNQVVTMFDLSLGLEMFYFGRPMFQTICHPAITVKNIDGYIQFGQTGQSSDISP